VQKTVFVDLEECLALSWADPIPCNHEKVERFLAEHGREVELFSFAVWNEKEVEIFREKHGPMLEREFNCKFVNVHPLSKVHDIVRRFNQVHFESWELSSIWGKARSFEDFCLWQNKTDWHFVLFDDTVLDKTIHYTGSNVIIELVRC
jgi:hypothetical protein